MIYVEKQRDGATVKTAKAMFWLVLLGFGLPMLLCVLGCFGFLVFAVSSDDLEPAGSVPTVSPAR